MFKNAVALNKVLHSNLRFTPQASYAFAAGEQLIPIVASEVAEAAKQHVIVFSTAQSALPLLLTGVEQGVNAYVDALGRWLASYVPAAVRRYPFALSEQPASQNASEAERRFTLCVVPDAPHFTSAQGEPLFDAGGAPAPVLQRTQALLSEVQKDSERTQFLVQQLDDLGLLCERTVPVIHAQGRAMGIQGLRVLDMERFKALEPHQLAALRESGALVLIHAHLESLRNLEKGPLSVAAASKFAPQRFMGQAAIERAQARLQGSREFPEGVRPFQNLGGKRH